MPLPPVVHRVVLASSVRVYEPQRVHGLTTPLNEDSPCKPILRYGHHKFLAEQLAADYRRRHALEGFALATVRPPVELAKQVASISRLANGSKVVLGVGTGWSRTEHEAMGTDFAQRGRALDTAIDLIREVWTGEPTPGDYGSFHIPEGTFTNPTPVAPISILIGGNSNAPLHRAARLGDGWVGYLADWEDDCAQLARFVDDLAIACSEVGRDCNELELTVVQTVPGRVAGDPNPTSATTRLLRTLRSARTRPGDSGHGLARPRSSPAIPWSRRGGSD